MLRVRLFDGVSKELVLYNGQSLINFPIDFFTEECDNDLDEDEIEYTFPGFVSGYFRVYNERLGKRIKNITGVTVSGSQLVINSNDLTFEDNGQYYYEIGYNSNGYEITLMFGFLNVI